MSRIHSFYQSHRCHLDASALDHDSLALTICGQILHLPGHPESAMSALAFELATACQQRKRIRSKGTK